MALTPIRWWACLRLACSLTKKGGGMRRLLFTLTLFLAPLLIGWMPPLELGDEVEQILSQPLLKPSDFSLQKPTSKPRSNGDGTRFCDADLSEILYEYDPMPPGLDETDMDNCVVTGVVSLNGIASDPYSVTLQVACIKVGVDGIGSYSGLHEEVSPDANGRFPMPFEGNVYLEMRKGTPYIVLSVGNERVRAPLDKRTSCDFSFEKIATGLESL